MTTCSTFRLHLMSIVGLLKSLIVCKVKHWSGNTSRFKMKKFKTLVTQVARLLTEDVICAGCIVASFGVIKS